MKWGGWVGELEYNNEIKIENEFWKMQIVKYPMVFFFFFFNERQLPPLY